MADAPRTVVVGGLGTIGAAVVARLRRDGHAVAVVDRAAPVAVDLADPGDCRRAVDAAAGALGGLDGLVNAGGTAVAEPFLSGRPETWSHCLAVNVVGPLACIQAAVPWLRSSAHPAIVNISSLAAVVGDARTAAYCASKAALEALTRSAALALASDGIRVVTVRPGLVDSPMATALTAALADLEGRSAEAMLAERLQRVPAGRAADAEEVAAAVAFAISPGASFVTGSPIIVDGGLLAG